MLLRKKWTALHYLQLEGTVDVVKVLIQNVADVNAVDSERHFTDSTNDC